MRLQPPLPLSPSVYPTTSRLSRGAPGLRLDALVKGSHLHEHGGGLRLFILRKDELPFPKGATRSHPWVLIKSLAPASRAAPQARAHRGFSQLLQPAGPPGRCAAQGPGNSDTQPLPPFLHPRGRPGWGWSCRRLPPQLLRVEIDKPGLCLPVLPTESGKALIAPSERVQALGECLRPPQPFVPLLWLSPYSLFKLVAAGPGCVC